MTIGVHPNRQKVPFASFVKSFEGIYTDDSSEKEVGLYALETIPKVGASSDQRRDDN
jgi:hypothetical protein